MPEAGYTIGANHALMDATVTEMNTQVGAMGADADELMAFILTLKTFWFGGAADAFDTVTGNMKEDFDASNLDLKKLAGMVGDFNLNLLNMDKQQTANFLGK